MSSPYRRPGYTPGWLADLRRETACWTSSGYQGWFRSHTQFIVFRGTNSPYDGMWYERAQMFIGPPTDSLTGMALHPSGTFERRDDGMLAEVYRP